MSRSPNNLTSSFIPHDGTRITDNPLVITTSSFDQVYEIDSRNPVIVKSIALLLFTLIGFVGNGIALATIWKTPKLRTKTYALLSSLTVSDLLTGLTMCWFVAYQLVAYVFNENRCSYILMVAILAFPQRVPLGVTIAHVGLISIERYIAVVHALHYERLMTYTTIKIMIAFGWIFPLVPTSIYLTFIGRIDWQTCTIVAFTLQAAIIDVCYIMIVIIVILFIYIRILITALRQRAKINSEVSKLSNHCLIIEYVMLRGRAFSVFYGL
jgi:hypothetical protein